MVVFMAESCTHVSSRSKVTLKSQDLSPSLTPNILAYVHSLRFAYAVEWKLSENVGIDDC